jgi:leucyl-tRNA synthetase
VDSSWYFLRFCDPTNDKAPFDPEKVAAWGPVDFYVGGPEHAVSHLLYFRFVTKALADLGHVPFREPARTLITQGAVSVDGVRMSYQGGNAVGLDEMVERYGADTVRLYSLFAAPPERDMEWDEAGLEGAFRFLCRLWRFAHEHCERVRTAPPVELEALAGESEQLWRSVHETIHRVSEDLDHRWHFNAAIASIMALHNELCAVDESVYQTETGRSILRYSLETLVRLLSPFAPHISEEIWSGLGHTMSVEEAGWPELDERALQSDLVTIVIQVNGKLRARLEVERAAKEDEVTRQVLSDPSVQRWTEGKEVERVIYVKDRLVNVVAQ